MANIKSQIKRNKTNEKARERNKAVKSELKTVIRTTRTAVSAGDKAAAEAALKKAAVKLDKAVSKGVLHKNQASNRKSALAKQVASSEPKLEKGPSRHRGGPSSLPRKVIASASRPDPEAIGYSRTADAWRSR